MDILMNALFGVLGILVLCILYFVFCLGQKKISTLAEKPGASKFMKDWGQWVLLIFYLAILALPWIFIEPSWQKNGTSWWYEFKSNFCWLDYICEYSNSDYTITWLGWIVLIFSAYCFLKLFLDFLGFLTNLGHR